MRADEMRGSVSRAAIGYALSTLVATVVMIGVVGGTPERVGGALVAWVIQSQAYWRLSQTLGARRDARRVWVGGMAARGLGLLVCGGLALTGLVGNDLPVAYGVSMLVLLLAEALWLARTDPSGVGVSASVGPNDEIYRTPSTG